MQYEEKFAFISALITGAIMIAVANNSATIANMTNATAGNISAYSN
jgi:hypothetical protein